MFRKKYEILENKKILFDLDLNENEVPQGICEVGKYILISCYKTDNCKSSVLVFKNNIKIKTISLSNKSHVGGIGYDEKHKLIFICDTNGRVSSYKFLEFVEGNLESKKTFNVSSSALGGSILSNKGSLVCSYLTIYDNKLYVGSFRRFRGGTVKVFDILGGDIKYNYEFKVPSKIQGLTFYKNYLLLSRSFGRKNKSRIIIYDLEKNLKKINTFKLPPMLEQIVVNKNNEVMLLFESGALKYRHTCKHVIDSVLCVDINKFI